MKSLCLLVLFLALSGGTACRQKARSTTGDSQETLSRTEFTDRIENFFEYEPLRAGKASRFNIHLTDLSEGSPVGNAEVTLIARSGNGKEVASSEARPGRVPGIYVAELALPRPGRYGLEFHVLTSGLDERMPLHGFLVE